MPGLSSEVRVVAEVLSSLGVCNVMVKWPDTCTAPVADKVCSTSSQFDINFSNNSVLKVNAPKGIKFASKEHEFISIDGRHLIVRLPLEANSGIIRSIVSDLAFDLRSLSIKTPYDSLCNRNIEVVCVGCGSPLSHTLHFNKVRQLPSSDWNHAAEEWFCCAHGNAYSKHKPEAIYPNLRECYFSDLYFLVQPDALDSSKTRSDCNENVLCSQCNEIFGIKDKYGIKLWTHRITWNEIGSDKVIYYRNITDILSSTIDNLTSDSFGANSKLVLVKRSKPKLFLYIAVIDTNLTILESIPPIHGSCKSDENSKTDSSGTKANNSIRSEKTFNVTLAKRNRPSLFDKDGVALVTLMKRTVIKVFHKIVEGESRETENWGNDVNVHLFHCAESFFDAVYTQLVDTAAMFCPVRMNLEDTNGLGDSVTEDLVPGYIIRN